MFHGQSRLVAHQHHGRSGSRRMFKYRRNPQTQGTGHAFSPILIANQDAIQQITLLNNFFVMRTQYDEDRRRIGSSRQGDRVIEQRLATERR